MADKVGSPFAQTLRGTAANDRLYGLGASDRLFGLDGNDQLHGDAFPPPDVPVPPQVLILVLPNDDRLIGGSGDDQLYGGSDNDWLIGGSGNDILVGGIGGRASKLPRAPMDDLLNLRENFRNRQPDSKRLSEPSEESEARPNQGTIDRLTGGEGNDLFVLGNTQRVFYASKNLRHTDRDDYAIITDFRDGEDEIRLKGGTRYKLEAVTMGKVSGIGVYVDRVASRPDELIGIVQGVRLADLTFTATPPLGLSILS